MKAESTNWLKLAREHYEDALYLFSGGRYSLCVYCCHQALEMILKGAIVEFVGKVPPKIHSLDLLARETSLTLPAKWYEDLAEITRHYWRVRYPDFRQFVYTSKDKVEPTLTKTKEVFLWISNKLDQHS